MGWPDWFQELRQDQGVAAAGVRWAAEADAPPFDKGMQWLTDEQVGLSNELLRGKLRVGRGPILYRLGCETRLELWLDSHQPDSLLVGLPDQPPFLWFPAGQSRQSLLRALAPYTPQELRRQPEPEPMLRRIVRQRAAQERYDPTPDPTRTGHCRLVLGVGLEAHLDLAELENHLLFNSACDAEFLVQGTAHWNRQTNPTATVVRTLFSRSIVTLLWYDYLEGALLVEVSYHPASHHDLIAAHNARFGYHFPTDLPLDVPTLLLGLHALNLPATQLLLAQMDTPQDIRYWLHVLAHLAVPDSEAALRPYLRHPDPVIRADLISLADQHAAVGLLQAMLEHENDPTLCARLTATLAPRYG